MSAAIPRTDGRIASAPSRSSPAPASTIASYGTRVDPADVRGDGAPQVAHGEVRAVRLERGATAERARARGRRPAACRAWAPGRRRADEHVARVRARQPREGRDVARKLGGQVLERVHARVDGTGAERHLELRREQPLRA